MVYVFLGFLATNSGDRNQEQNRRSRYRIDQEIKEKLGQEIKVWDRTGDQDIE